MTIMMGIVVTGRREGGVASWSSYPDLQVESTDSERERGMAWSFKVSKSTSSDKPLNPSQTILPNGNQMLNIY